MTDYPEYPRLGHRRSFSLRAPNLLTKVVAVIVGTAVLIGAVAVSFVLFAVALTGILIFGVYAWWKTRDLRKQLQSLSMPRGGTVIEGEARDVTPDREPKK
jgi:hypothetical protein